MSEEKIVVKNCKLEFVTTKADNYNNDISYFKLLDKNIEQKYLAIMKNGFKLPWFKTKEGRTIIKIKSKYNKLKELNKEDIVTVDICFKYYNMDDTEGYYVCQLC